jgi:tRNA threonylcarbamoyladenosine modification (KEOPS) complex  Pcc1 subunit
MNELTINLCMPEDLSEICIKSITTEDRKFERSNVEVSRTESGLLVYITAHDLSALRAALNTYMRWIIMCCELVGNKNLIKI